MEKNGDIATHDHQVSRKSKQPGRTRQRTRGSNARAVALEIRFRIPGLFSGPRRNVPPNSELASFFNPDYF